MNYSKNFISQVKKQVIILNYLINNTEEKIEIDLNSQNLDKKLGFKWYKNLSSNLLNEMSQIKIKVFSY